MKRKLRKLLDLLNKWSLSLISGLMLVSGVASAELSPTPTENTWVTDGEVRAIVSANGITYIGGDFTHVGPNTGHGVPIDATTGSLVPTFPRVNGAVRVSVPDGFGGFYIGGEFTRVGGITRNRLARILSDGTVCPIWDPNVIGGPVLALAVSGTTVYAGGTFTSIGGQTRNRIAAIDATTGIPTGWNPNANAGVRALVVSGTTVYAGGEFTIIGAQTPQPVRNRIAAIDITTGNATGWNPDANGWVRALAVSGGIVYIGGDFTSIGTPAVTRNRLAAINMDATGTLTGWNPNANGTVRALAVSGTTVYAGGGFTGFGPAGVTARNRLAAINMDATGTLTGWNPNANGWVLALAVSGTTVYAGGDFTTIGAQTPQPVRNRIAAIDITTGNATPWNPNANGDVSALAVSGNTVYAGGWFTSIGGQTRNRIAAIDATTGIPTAWNPNANATVHALAVSGATVYAGGDFTTIGAQTPQPVRNRIAAIEIATGNATGWNPNAGGSVRALVVSGTTVYAGGEFTIIGAQTPQPTRNRIAAIDITTGNATDWNPNANSGVHALAVSGATVYAGGDFSTIGAQAPQPARNRIAAIEIATGNATAWNPNASGGVLALAVSGTTVYAGGGFTTIGAQVPQPVRNRIAAIEIATGNATDWNPNASGSVLALAVSGTTVYAGGDFTTIGAQVPQPVRNRIAAIEIATGNATAWNPNASSSVRALAVSGTTVYAGGSFTSIGGELRPRFAQFDTPIIPPPTPTPPDRFFSCFIATAVFGTPMAEEVVVLSRFRDEYLLTNELGRKFVSLYYQHSPALAEYISDREWAKRIVRIALSPLVRIAEFMVGE